MEMPLSFEYDEAGDILYINKTQPYPEQETEPLAYNVLARRNPHTGAVENVEILFFTRWMLKGDQARITSLKDLFAEPSLVA